MTRIVLFPSAFLPDLGGVEELTRHLALTLAAGGDEIEVWTNQRDETKGTTTETLDGLTVRRFPCPLPRMRLGSVLSWSSSAASSMAAMRNALRKFRPELIHVQCFGPNGAYATALSVLARTPLVITLQGETFMDDSDIFEQSLSLRVALKFALKRAAGITGCSSFALADAERRFSLNRNKGRVIFNGVHTPAHTTSEAHLPFRYVLAVGRIVEKKGFDLLIQAFAKLSPEHPDVKLVIAGVGEALDNLKQLTSELSLDGRIHFAGRLSREEVATTMAGAELFVMPSRVEPFGIVILEAWAAGTPVVASSRGGSPEFVDDGITGLLVDPSDVDTLASVINQVLSRPSLRSSLSSAGRQRVADFSWTRIADEYRQLYLEVAKGRGR